ncbi:MAG: hypothetical protein IIY81_11040 [Lachnospiraceae bacterium]|nr:hypothetical protein [Lachnospiraceae bacterium]
MKYTAINIPSLERIAKVLEKQNKLQEKAIEQSERMLKLQENYFKAEEERRNNFRKREEKELRNLMKDPRYWKHQDPEVVKRVEEGFKRLYG